MELILSLSYLDVFFLQGERVREEGSGRCRPIVRLSTGLRYSGLETFLIKVWILLPRRDLSLSFTFIGNKFIRNIFDFSPLKYSDTVELSALQLLLEIIITSMKKKVQEKKEIIPIFEAGVFWEYTRQPQEIVDKVDTFLTTFTNELKAIILPERPFEDNYEAVCLKAGYNVHPSLARKYKEASQFPSLRSNDYGQKFAIFLNHRIDMVTLKLFGFVVQNVKLNCIKFSNNSLDDREAEQVKKIIEKEDQLTTLYFEWNPLAEHPKRHEIFMACVRPSLHHLILRECHLGDDLARDLLKKLKEVPQGKLKSLDLYCNDLTPAIMGDISVFLEESKTLEFLGLSKNVLSTEECLTKLLGSIGEVALSEQEYEQHKLKEKARDQVVERNKKRKKGAPEEPVPFVFEIKQTPNGKYYVKNTSLKILNLASNSLKDGLAGQIRKFVEGNGKGVELFIEGNKFSKASKEAFKFYDNVIS